MWLPFCVSVNKIYQYIYNSDIFIYNKKLLERSKKNGKEKK